MTGRRGIRAALLVLAGLLGCGLLTGIAGAGTGGQFDDTGTGIVVSNEVYTDAGGGGTAAYEYSVTRLSENNCTEEEIRFGGCVPGSFSSCAAGRPAGPEYDWALANVQRRLIGSAAWEVLPRQCLNFAVIAPQVTPEMAYEQMLQLLPVLNLGYAPTAEGLVNLPVIVYTDPTQVWTFPPVVLVDQAVIIRSTVIAYTWSFGAAEMTTDWPGRPFADDCPAIPCAGYVSYPFSAPGSYQIGLTVTWTGEFSVNGGAWQPVSDVGTTVSPPQDVTILEAHPVLTDPYD